MIPEALATYRLTRLIVRDGILHAPRERVFLWAYRVKDGRAAHPKIAELIGCAWCVSIWAALVVLVLRRWAWGRALIRLLALSAAAGFASEVH
jgi:hypothetical protein